ncbi:hypothetical protein [Pullulanibacillus camelliae]|uniref:hypothetical protein n=1 Tax=Pullulanibacillus camelliae TaxID=1707096 RepID=UPI0016661289|nr:hypothetical protein [Pullulanibacillus camelliae]
MLFRWPLESETTITISQEVVKTTARVISWGIFGTAIQWSRDSQGRSVEEMMQDVLLVVTASLAPIID